MSWPYNDPGAIRLMEAIIDRRIADPQERRGGELAALLPKARLAADLSAVVAHEAFAGVALSMSALANARGNVVDSHKRLEALRTKLHLPEMGGGDKDPIPDVVTPKGLRAVG